MRSEREREKKNRKRHLSLSSAHPPTEDEMGTRLVYLSLSDRSKEERERDIGEKNIGEKSERHVKRVRTTEAVMSRLSTLVKRERESTCKDERVKENLTRAQARILRRVE